MQSIPNFGAGKFSFDGMKIIVAHINLARKSFKINSIFILFCKNKYGPLRIELRGHVN